MSVRELLVGLERAVEAGEHRLWAVRCAHALGLEGIAVSLRWGSELVWFSDEISARLEDAQFTLGQGPGMEKEFGKFGQGPCHVPDLGSYAGERWPQFVAAARALGVGALFVWPIRSGTVRCGTLTGYRGSPGPLTARQEADGLRVADALTGRLLAWRPGEEAAAGGVDGAGEAGVVELHRAEVHQATGVLSYQLGVPMEEALVRMRARAFASGLPLTEVAREILRALPS
ncbi:GAF and ANTAR domain-containing protein [Streptomyces longisporoflavus]|uniref:GAF and ANTAR domain-containing protein n=1 Tax=Streptomyces longisporoflavus TaxID=28044 RepID=UPI00167E18A5|nr:ANTAR domain-containing protein [Streptomyces longisporoflavus]